MRPSAQNPLVDVLLSGDGAQSVNDGRDALFGIKASYVQDIQSSFHAGNKCAVEDSRIGNAHGDDGSGCCGWQASLDEGVDGGLSPRRQAGEVPQDAS